MHLTFETNWYMEFADGVSEGGRFDRLEDEFLWLKESCVGIPVYNVDEPRVPLKL